MPPHTPTPTPPRARLRALRTRLVPLLMGAAAIVLLAGWTGGAPFVAAAAGAGALTVPAAAVALRSRFRPALDAPALVAASVETPAPLTAPHPHPDVLPHDGDEGGGYRPRDIVVLVAAMLILLVPTLLILEGKVGHLLATNRALASYGILVTSVVLTVLTVAYTRYRDPAFARPDATQNPLPLVSLIVAARDEEVLIERCVRSLLDTQYPNREIIVIDDQSNDATPQILARLAASESITVIALEHNVGKKRALAEGVRVSRGDIIVFTDSDSVLHPMAVSHVVRAFRSDQNIGAVSGHCRALNGDATFLTRVQDSWYEGQFRIWKGMESSFGAVSCVSGPLAGFRREAIYNLIPAWCEDRFLGKEFRFATDRQLTGYVLGSAQVGDRLKAQHAESPFVSEVDYPVREWRVVYSRAARAWTEVPPTFKRMLRQQVRWKKSFIRNLFFTGAFYWRKPLIPAFCFYGRCVFRLLGPLVAARQLIYLPLSGEFDDALLYLAGIVVVGSTFAVAFKLDNPRSTRWIYRPFMSLMSTFVFCWLIFYSALTLRSNVWFRG
jgi:cellulose synthase/poly-beta-1,6-N-acetylglucosamine synthase-like glycosyltransferase